MEGLALLKVFFTCSCQHLTSKMGPRGDAFDLERSHAIQVKIPYSKSLFISIFLRAALLYASYSSGYTLCSKKVENSIVALFS